MTMMMMMMVMMVTMTMVFFNPPDGNGAWCNSDSHRLPILPTHLHHCDDHWNYIVMMIVMIIWLPGWSLFTVSIFSAMAAFMVSIPPGFETFNVIVNHDDIASEIFFTCWLPRYQAFITFRGSSIGVGKVSDGPLASLLGSFPVVHMDEFPFLYLYWLILIVE